jgi:hypothetical protein
MKNLHQIVFLVLFSLSIISISSIPASFASVTYSIESSPTTIPFGECRQGESPFPRDIRIFDLVNNLGGFATVETDDYYANMDCNVKDFIEGTAIQPSSTTTVISTETEISSGMFEGSFLVTDKFEEIEIEIVDSLEDVEIVEDGFQYIYEFAPENAALGEVRIPSGFSGNLTFSDVIVSDDEADATCFFPVTGALKITGPLPVQPEIILSYANANFSGVTAGNTGADLGMYYKNHNNPDNPDDDEQFELITLPFITETGFVNIPEKEIESKNDSENGSVSGTGILIPGGWNGITDYQVAVVLLIHHHNYKYAILYNLAGLMYH